MNYGRLAWQCMVVSIVSAFLIGCAGTPKVTQWQSPAGLSMDKVFSACLVAATDSKFTVVTQEKSLGLISANKQEYAGNKMSQRTMNIRLKKAGDKIQVSTNVSGSDFGIIEGTLGGAVNQEISRNFFVYLFRELDITDPSLRNVIMVDAQ